MVEEKTEQQTSKYNSGMSIIMRLDELWKDVNKHSRQGSFSKWNADLDRVWCELARDLKPEEYDDKKKSFDNFDFTIGNLGTFEDDANDTFTPLTNEQIKKRNNQYHSLMEKELFLRRLENELGKGTAWSDESEEDWD